MKMLEVKAEIASQSTKASSIASNIDIENNFYE